jgi:hypothetical protein
VDPKILVTAGIVVALLTGVAVGWVSRGPRIGELEGRVSDLENALRVAESRMPTATNDATRTDVPDEPVIPGGPATPEEPPATEPVVPGGEREEPTGPTERQPGLVVDVIDSAGTAVMRIDYVQVLTGGEAADAAAAHGDESPPPNDYYVVNDNPKIREFPIQAGIPVFVVTNDDGSSDAAGHTLTLSQWISALQGPNGDSFKANIYWVQVTNGTVTSIEAQYVP